MERTRVVPRRPTAGLRGGQLHPGVLPGGQRLVHGGRRRWAASRASRSHHVGLHLGLTHRAPILRFSGPSGCSRGLEQKAVLRSPTSRLMRHLMSVSSHVAARECQRRCMRCDKPGRASVIRRPRTAQLGDALALGRGSGKVLGLVRHGEFEVATAGRVTTSLRRAPCPPGRRGNGQATRSSSSGSRENMSGKPRSPLRTSSWHSSSSGPVLVSAPVTQRRMFRRVNPSQPPIMNTNQLGPAGGSAPPPAT